MPIRGLLMAAGDRKLKARIVDVRNSGDTAGGTGEVVGYGAYAFSEAVKAMDQRDREFLLETARASIEFGVREGVPLTVDPSTHGHTLQRLGASFVTLRIDGDLRGCMGTSTPTRALITDVADNAFAAGFRDSRFQPLAQSEVESLSIGISVQKKISWRSCVRASTGWCCRRGSTAAPFFPQCGRRWVTSGFF
jgi:hypothetical protein